MAYISPEIGRLLAKQVREGRQRMDDRRARSKERWESRRSSTDLVGEPLECPTCDAHYELGAVCPDCDVELVPAGSGDFSVPPPPRHRTLFHIALSIGALFGGIALFAWLATL